MPLLSISAVSILTVFLHIQVLSIKKPAFSTLYIHPQVSLHKIELWFLYTLLRGGSTGNTGQLFLSPILEKGDTVCFAEPSYDAYEKILVKIMNDLAVKGINIESIPSIL